MAATLLHDAWGNERGSTGSNWGRYRFTGAERDATTGFYHMGARFYDPTIGRWLSEDPVQDDYFRPLTLNFYAYVQNNPVILTDPTGKNYCDAACQDEIKRQEKELLNQLLENLKKAESLRQARAIVEAFVKPLENLPVAVAARIASAAALAASGFALGAAVTGNTALANMFSAASVMLTAVSGVFTTAQYAQGQLPSMAHIVSQGFNLASAVMGAVSKNARFGPLMTPDQAVAMAFAIASLQMSMGSVALTFYNW